MKKETLSPEAGESDIIVKNKKEWKTEIVLFF